VRAVTPAAGPETGGTLLTVHGDGFVNAPTLACRFTRVGGSGEALAIDVPATWLAAEAVQCVAPPLPAAPADGAARSGAARIFALSVTLNGVDFAPGVPASDAAEDASAAPLFAFFAPPEVRGALPPFGSLEGGTAVTLVGSRLAPLSGDGAPIAAALCRFGRLAVGAEVVNATALRCIAPPADAPGRVALSVSLNGGADWSGGDDGATTTSAAVHFAYAAPLVFEDVSPALGPAAGGTRILVRGAGFRGAAAAAPGAFDGLADEEAAAADALASGAVAACRFGAAGSGAVVPARILHDGALECVSPPVTAAIYDEVTDAPRVDTPSAALAEALEGLGGGATRQALTLGGEVRAVPLSISLNGEDFVEIAGASFVFVDAPVVLAVTPSRGTALGGTRLRLSLSSVPQTASLVCVFRFMRANATACAPALRRAGALLDAGAVPLPLGTPMTDVSAAELADACGSSAANDMHHDGSFVDVAIPATALSARAAECTTPRIPSGDVESSALLAMSVNGGEDVDWAASSLFRFSPPIVVEAVEPPTGPVSGGTIVLVRGTGFVSDIAVRDGDPTFDAPRALAPATTTAWCRFGFAVVPALVLDAHSARCLVPAFATAASPDASGSVAVELSSNGGADWSSSRVFFE
jgi:hypothetical protein